MAKLAEEKKEWRKGTKGDKVNTEQRASDGRKDKRENEDRRERGRQLRVGFRLGGCQKVAEK